MFIVGPQISRIWSLEHFCQAGGWHGSGVLSCAWQCCWLEWVTPPQLLSVPPCRLGGKMVELALQDCSKAYWVRLTPESGWLTSVLPVGFRRCCSVSVLPESLWLDCFVPSSYCPYLSVSPPLRTPSHPFLSAICLSSSNCPIASWPLRGHLLSTERMLHCAVFGFLNPWLLQEPLTLKKVFSLQMNEGLLFHGSASMVPSSVLESSSPHTLREAKFLLLRVRTSLSAPNSVFFLYFQKTNGSLQKCWMTSHLCLLLPEVGEGNPYFPIQYFQGL